MPPSYWKAPQVAGNGVVVVMLGSDEGMVQGTWMLELERERWREMCIQGLRQIFSTLKIELEALLCRQIWGRNRGKKWGENGSSFPPKVVPRIHVFWGENRYTAGIYTLQGSWPATFQSYRLP